MELTSNKWISKRINRQSIASFRWNKILKELIGSNKVKKNKVKRRQLQKLKPGKCSLFLTNVRSLCCKKVQKTTTFKSQQTKEIYKIFHNVNSASSFVIYLMECNSCNKQYVGKAETNLNTRLNNHQKMWKSGCNNGLQTFLTRKSQFPQTFKIFHYWSVKKHLQI